MLGSLLRSSGRVPQSAIVHGLVELEPGVSYPSVPSSNLIECRTLGKLNSCEPAHTIFTYLIT